MTTLYYEDVAPGHRWTSAGRTITEADNTFFCMLSGDWNPVHSNAEYCKNTRFGQRIVAGVFGISLITGAMSQWGIFEESAIAMLNLRDWSFQAPIFIGDTVTVSMEIVAKRLTSRGAGIIERRFELRRQDGAVLQVGLSDMMIALRPSEHTTLQT